jgi:hypothetical protein
MNYEIYPSNKRGFSTKESYIVTRQGESFLRIVGGDQFFEVLTATASEDNRGGFRVCGERASIIGAAVQLSAELGVNPGFSKDSSGREFINICGISLREPCKVHDDEWAEIDSALCRFFDIFDDSRQTPGNGRNDLQEIYGDLATDDSGDEVYLVDGVWLSSDGTLHDRGR